MRNLNHYHRYLLFVLLTASYWALPGQSWNSELYFGVPISDKSPVLLDEFENNDLSWKMDRQQFSERIHEGDYYCASLTNKSGVRSHWAAIDQKGDYEAELRLRFVRGVGNPAAGLYLGGDEGQNGFSFNFDSEGRYGILLHRGTHVYPLKHRTPCNELSRYSYNSLLLRKVGKRWYFFVNQQLVANLPAQPLFGQEFGFYLEERMAIEVDFIRVSQLEVAKEQDLTGPVIHLQQPELAANNRLTVDNPQQLIHGRLEDAAGLRALHINGQTISLSADGEFKASLSLPEGEHHLIMVATDALGNESKREFFLTYRPAVPSPAPGLAYQFIPPETIPEKSTKLPSEDSTPNWGAYSNSQGETYLLLIGVNAYENWNPLHNAVKDCQDIARALTDHYQFDEQHIVSLYDQQATRENILETFESLQEKLTEQDNLLIYYAGHGYYDASADLGYWVPVNARTKKIPDFIRNSTIHDYLRAINTKHTLLIADACYAGSLFASYRGTSLSEDAKSRWAFTSGDVEKVWDGQPGGNSPFADYLIRYLTNNRQSDLPANELIEAVGSVVGRNTSQTPQGSCLRRAGDEGGVFIFHRK